MLAVPAKDRYPGAGVLDPGAPVRKGFDDEANLAPVRVARKPRHAVVGAGERTVGQRLNGTLEVDSAEDVEAVVL